MKTAHSNGSYHLYNGIHIQPGYPLKKLFIKLCFILICVIIFSYPTVAQNIIDSSRIVPAAMLSKQQLKMQLIYQNRSNYTYLVGRPFGKYSVKDLNGNILTNDSVKGKIVFYNFWFESCHFCHNLFEPLNALYEHYKNEPRFELISFTFDTKEVLAQNITKYNLRYRNIATTNNLCHSLMFDKGFPANFLVDGKGNIVFGTGGSQLENENYFSEFIIPQIDKLLADLRKGN